MSRFVKTKSFRPRFESLEDRRLMAAVPAATLAGGVLTVTGTDAADTLAFKQSAGRLSISGISTRFSVSQVSKIVVDGKGGNDQILLNSEARQGQPIQIPTSLVGGSGNDSIIGAAAADQIFGGLGNDTMQGGRGNDVLDGRDDFLSRDSLSGGEGDDTLFGERGSDTLDGGAGNNQLTWLEMVAAAETHAVQYASTTLKNAINPGDDIIYVNNGSALPKIGSYPLNVRIGSEIVRIWGYSGNDTWWVDRGTLGTTAQRHAAGAVISPYEAAASTAPSAPDPVRATAVSSTQLNVTWSNVTGEQTYSVWLNDGNGWRSHATTQADVTSVSIGNLYPSTTYQVIVGAYNAVGHSFTRLITVTTPAAGPIMAPQKPGWVNVAHPNATSAVISWPAVTGADKYIVEHWVSASQYVYYTVAKTATSFQINGLAPNTLHYFRVGAVNAIGGSYTDWTSTFTGAPAAPTLSFRKGYSDAYETIVNFSWNDVAGEMKYTLYQYKSGAWVAVATLPANRASHYLQLSTTSRGGWFALKAENALGSSWSQALSVYF